MTEAMNEGKMPILDAKHLNQFLYGNCIDGIVDIKMRLPVIT